MISKIQKTNLIDRITKIRLLSGTKIIPDEILGAAENLLINKQLGRPLTIFRPAVPSLPVGGRDGKDLERTFQELLEDLEVLYKAVENLSLNHADLYELLIARDSLITLGISDVTARVNTLLAQLSVISKDSITTDFHRLDDIDFARTTADVDIIEGSASLSPDNTFSRSYPHQKIKVIKETGNTQPGSRFLNVFNPSNSSFWYSYLNTDDVYEIIISLTGADYDKGDTEEVPVNGIRIDTITSLKLSVDWSPDGYNWHSLNPTVERVIDKLANISFETVTVGYLRLKIRKHLTNEVGIRNITFMERAHALSAAIYSNLYVTNKPIRNLSFRLNANIPAGTRVNSFISQAYDGPWIPVGRDIVTFDNLQDIRITLDNFSALSSGSYFYKAEVPDPYLLPETGELVVGSEQVLIKAFPYDWGVEQAPNRIPELSDWDNPNGIVRGGTFSPLGDIGNSSELTSGFYTERNPLAYDVLGDSFYNVIVVSQSDGNFLLQPGYNYNLEVMMYASTPKTITNCKIGLVNYGGAASAIILPHAVYLNSVKVYEGTKSVTSVDEITDSMTLNIEHGWNRYNLCMQLPLGVELDHSDGSNGVSSGAIHLYFQPCLYTPSRASVYGIDSIQAYNAPWTKVSELFLKYSVSPGNKTVWAWDIEESNGNVVGVLFNHNPLNPAPGRLGYSTGQSYYTIDGLNAPQASDINLFYTVERVNTSQNPRHLYVRLELEKSESVYSIPQVYGYSIIINPVV